MSDFAHTLRYFGVAILMLTATACGGQGNNEGGQEGASGALITVDGSSTVFPIAEAVAEEFGKANRNVRTPTVGISGTGGGFQKFCRGETDISNASRPIRPAEIEACKTAGIEYIEVPIAYDGIAIVVNPKNTWANSITVDELKTMWAPEAQGKITRWNQVRPSWPNREIRLFGAGVDSGTYDYFTEATVGKEGASRGEWPEDPQPYQTATILVGAVSQLIITWLIYRRPRDVTRAAMPLIERMLTLLTHPLRNGERVDGTDVSNKTSPSGKRK